MSLKDDFGFGVANPTVVLFSADIGRHICRGQGRAILDGVSSPRPIPNPPCNMASHIS